MNISPLDIRKHEFRKTFRGYDPEEVAAFLELVSSEFETLIREQSQFKERLAGTSNQLASYHDIESTLRETLLSAQRAREDTLMTAKKQADIIVREAEVKAAAIIDEGHREIARLRVIFNEMRVLKDSYFARLKALVNAQYEMLDTIESPEEQAMDALDNSAVAHAVGRGSAQGKPENQAANSEAVTERGDRNTIYMDGRDELTDDAAADKTD